MILRLQIDDETFEKFGEEFDITINIDDGKLKAYTTDCGVFGGAKWDVKVIMGKGMRLANGNSIFQTKKEEKQYFRIKELENENEYLLKTLEEIEAEIQKIHKLLDDANGGVIQLKK